MSNWSRKVRKRKQVELDDVAHAKAMAEIRKWEKGLVQHWLVTVRRLMMARMEKRQAELKAYRAIVAGLQGRDMDEAAAEIASEE